MIIPETGKRVRFGKMTYSFFYVDVDMCVNARVAAPGWYIKSITAPDHPSYWIRWKIMEDFCTEC